MGSKKLTEEELAFGESIFQEDIIEAPDIQEVSRARSLLGAVPRGVAEAGMQEVRRIGGDIALIPGVGRLAETALEQLETRPEGFQAIEGLLPTQERMPEEILKKTGEILPLVVAGSPSLVSAGVRSLMAGAASIAAKEAGAPPMVQGLVEAIPFAFPSLTRRIPTKSTEEVLDFARRMNMTENDIALLSKNPEKLPGMIEQIAAKGGRVARQFDKTYQSLERTYNMLLDSSSAQTAIDPRNATRLFKDLDKAALKLPNDLRKKILPDVRDFRQSKRTIGDAVNLWQDLNYYIRKVDSKAGALKEPIRKMLKQVDPTFAREFSLTNELYGKFAELSSVMKPDLAEKMIQAGERGLMLSAAVEGNFPLMKKILGPIAGRQLAATMVINPKLQRLGQRTVNALNNFKFPIAKQLLDKFATEIAKENPEAGSLLSQIEIDELLFEE